MVTKFGERDVVNGSGVNSLKLRAGVSRARREQSGALRPRMTMCVLLSRTRGLDAEALIKKTLASQAYVDLTTG